MDVSFPPPSTIPLVLYSFIFYIFFFELGDVARETPVVEKLMRNLYLRTTNKSVHFVKEEE